MRPEARGQHRRKRPVKRQLRSAWTVAREGDRSGAPPHRSISVAVIRMGGSMHLSGGRSGDHCPIRSTFEAPVFRINRANGWLGGQKPHTVFTAPTAKPSLR